MNCSLYIHIPFCTKKCDYCDFFSVPHTDHSLIHPDENYVKALLNEAAFYSAFYEISSWNTIYLGGGTPSRLGPELLNKLVSGLRTTSGIPEDYQEITVEMNPDDITYEMLKSAEEAGVNRISIGIQALDNKALSKINRQCSKEKALNALELLKQNWKGRLSVDFIAGLPGQTFKSFEKQFEILKEYPVDHVSLYTLTIEENTPLYKRIENGTVKFSQEKADRMWIKGRNILEKMGFEQYEVSNFCKPGSHSRHNSVYWALKSYAGCGAGASGSIYEKKLRWTNTTNIKKYEDFWLSAQSIQNIQKNVDKIRQVETLTPEIQEFEFLMMGFRTLKGLSSVEYSKRFGKSLEERLGIKNGLFKEWTDRKLTKKYEINGECFYALNRRGIMLLNRFLESLL